MNSRLIPLALLGAAALAAPLLAKPATHAVKPAPSAAWLADPLRSEDMRKLDEGRMPAAVLAFAGVKPGQTVLDFIAGNGYYSLLLARAVGPKGMVFAANPPGENNPKAWEPLAGKVPQLHVMVAEIPQMQFAPRSLDLIFTNLNYHDPLLGIGEIPFPSGRRAPGAGRVVYPAQARRARGDHRSRRACGRRTARSGGPSAPDRSRAGKNGHDGRGIRAGSRESIAAPQRR